MSQSVGVGLGGVTLTVSQSVGVIHVELLPQLLHDSVHAALVPLLQPRHQVEEVL